MLRDLVWYTSSAMLCTLFFCFVTPGRIDAWQGAVLCVAYVLYVCHVVIGDGASGTVSAALSRISPRHSARSSSASFKMLPLHNAADDDSSLDDDDSDDDGIANAASSGDGDGAIVQHFSDAEDVESRSSRSRRSSEARQSESLIRRLLCNAPVVFCSIVDAPFRLIFALTIPRMPLGGEEDAQTTFPRSRVGSCWESVNFSGLRTFLCFIISMLWIGAITFAVTWIVESTSTCLAWRTDLVGITLLAAGSSLPDLLGSIIVARAGKIDMAVANALGSNVFDLTICIGLPALFRGVTSAAYVFYGTFSPAASVALNNQVGVEVEPGRFVHSLGAPPPPFPRDIVGR